MIGVALDKASRVQRWLDGLRYERMRFRKCGWFIGRTYDGPGLAVGTGYGVSYFLWNRHGD